MMSPHSNPFADQGSSRKSNQRSSSDPLRQAPLQVVHILGILLRIWSVFSMYELVWEQGAPVLVFIFSCLVASSLIFLASQRPWKGRPLANTQVVPSVINGVIMALYFVLWGKGLKSCGPVRAIMAEYAGAWLGVLSAVLYGRRRQLWKKVGGFVGIALSFYFFSAGWATATHSPFSFGDNSGSDASSQRADAIGIKEMLIPVFAGILSALRRVVARRVSLKNQLKRRLHAITITSATCFLFPFTIWETALGSTSDGSSKSWFFSWAYISTVLFGIVLIFYIDNMAEERLHMVVSSPRHLMISGGSIIVMAIAYGMDFSLLGFLVCCSVLAVGIHQATSFERFKKGEDDPVDSVDDSLASQTSSPLPS